MGIFKTLGLSESEKNEIGSYKYDKALEILEDLDKFCLKKSDNKFTRIDNFFDLKEGIKIGKYEIGGATLDDFFRDLKIGTIGFAKLANEDNRKHIFWIRNSETDEIKTYSKFESNGVRIFYDTEKDELFTYDENGKDNLYVGLQNVKHYYARNYSTIDGFKFLDDDIRTPLSVYKLDEIFSCNFKELQATGTWSNQNEFNTLKKDQEKYDKIKEKILQQKEDEYLEKEAEKKERKRQEKEKNRENSLSYKIIQYFIKDDEKKVENKDDTFIEKEKSKEKNSINKFENNVNLKKNNIEKDF
jgi:hypothetical protein